MTEQKVAKSKKVSSEFSLPKFTMKEMLEAGVHFGHKVMRWNPKMAPFIYGEKNGVHIIDLQKTYSLMCHALDTIYKVAKQNGRILFVGTKRQASTIIAERSKECGQYYVNHRWLGGMLTNWGTVSRSIKKMDLIKSKLEKAELDGGVSLTKKEKLDLSRKYAKLEKSLGGIKNMGGIPNLIFVVDAYRESLAVKEANTLGIPVVGIVDTNSDPKGVDYIVPGNDDSSAAIDLYCRLISHVILDGIRDNLKSSGFDLGALDDAVKQEIKGDKVAGKSGAKSKPEEVKGDDLVGQNDVADVEEQEDVSEKEVAKKPVAAKKEVTKVAPAKKPASPVKKTNEVKKVVKKTTTKK